MRIDGVGDVLESGEWWRLIYARCGHERRFPRIAHGLFDPPQVEHEVRTLYSECTICARPLPYVPPPGH
jgi:hypothetical protein